MLIKERFISASSRRAEVSAQGDTQSGGGGRGGFSMQWQADIYKHSTVKEG